MTKRAKRQPLPDIGCHNCRHWREDPEPGSDERTGDCHAHPPHVMWDAEDAAVFRAWPPTTAADVCGEHAPRLQ